MKSVSLLLVLGLNLGGWHDDRLERVHDGFDRECCSGKDCHPVPVGDVRWVGMGWRVVDPITRRVMIYPPHQVRQLPPAVKNRSQFYACPTCLYQPDGEV